VIIAVMMARDMGFEVNILLAENRQETGAVR
jgi:hypothetical protein